MLGPTTVALMLLPVALGVAVALVVRPQLTDRGWRVSGVWSILLAAPVAVACDHWRPQVSDPAVLNRAEAVCLCVIAAAFVVLNRGRVRIVRASARMVAAGVWLNALGVLVYGAMPVLQSAAAIADKPFTGAHPSPGYVRSEDLGAFGVVVGDFIPIPHFFKVLSIGDLLLFAGCIVLVGLFLARTWQTETTGDAPPETHEDKEVTHG